MTTFDVTAFLLGLFGGFLAELVRWYGLRESPDLPVYLKSPAYWLATAGMILSGGVIAALTQANMPPITVIIFGAGIPATISRLLSLVPEPPLVALPDTHSTAPDGEVVVFMVRPSNMITFLRGIDR